MKNSIYKEVADSLNYDEETVKDVFYYTWEFIRKKISELQFKGTDYTEEEFNQLRTSFNLLGLGKLACTYKNYIGQNKKYKRGKSDGTNDEC